MKLKPYREILEMGKDLANKTIAPIRAAKAKKQAELEVAKLDEQIATLEADIFEICSKTEIDFSAIIEMQDKLALTERKKKQFVKIIEEMFPED
jgi:phosphate uptake regulator